MCGFDERCIVCTEFGVAATCSKKRHGTLLSEWYKLLVVVGRLPPESREKDVRFETQVEEELRERRVCLGVGLAHAMQR